jgi:hypothetical protein
MDPVLRRRSLSMSDRFNPHDFDRAPERFLISIANIVSFGWIAFAFGWYHLRAMIAVLVGVSTLLVIAVLIVLAYSKKKPCLSG